MPAIQRTALVTFGGEGEFSCCVESQRPMDAIVAAEVSAGSIGTSGASKSLSWSRQKRKLTCIGEHLMHHGTMSSGEGYSRSNSPSCARSLNSSYFWYAQTLGEKLITPQSQAQKLTVRKCIDAPCLTSIPGTVVAIPLRCNPLNHLPRRRIILHDMKRRPVRPHMVKQRPICMRCRNFHERAVAVSA